MDSNFDKIRKVLIDLPMWSSEKITAENIAKAAKVSRATFYRYLKKHSLLAQMYARSSSPLRQVVLRAWRGPVDTVKDGEESLAQLKQEMKTKQDEYEARDKSRNAQIMLLWKENRRLRALLLDAGKDPNGKIMQFQPRKRK